MKSSSFGQLLKLDPLVISFLKTGDIVDAKLIKKEGGACYFDLGRFGTGIICGVEFINAKNILKDIKIGDSLTAKVVEPENEDGYVELSLVGASQQKVWQELMKRAMSANFSWEASAKKYLELYKKAINL